VEAEVQAVVGVSLLETAHANDIELEGTCEASWMYRLLHHLTPRLISTGACEGSLACSTCHVIVEVPAAVVLRH
jgi:ferredoxin